MRGFNSEIRPSAFARPRRPSDPEARSEGATTPFPFVDRHGADAEVKGELDDRGFSQVETGQQGG
jgi:hypothetical protein